MNGIPIALQLYSVREACQEDFPGALKAIADMGYEGVEFAGFYGYEADEIRDILDDLGLRVAGSHTGLDMLLGDDVMDTVTFNETLDNPYLIVPGLPEIYRNSRQAWLSTAELFNDLNEKLRTYGMYTGYHNHHVEFTPYEDGQTPWDLIFDNTDLRVIMQLDIGNALHGGGDPVLYLKRYPRRARTIHIKDHAADKEKVLVGEGDVDWQEILEIVEKQGETEWYIIEQETYPYPPLESVRRSLANFKAIREE